jgi:alpha-ketoglutarate-dependent taurine dioxygenase
MPIAATTPSPPPRSSSLPLRLKTLASTLGRPALSFGAEEVSGFDLRALADHGTGQRAVHDALLAHGLLIFRGQRLTEAQELALATRFPHDSRFRPPALEYLGNVDRHGTRLEHFVRGGRYWHVDGSQNALPMVMSWISAAEPGSARCGGSRTLFASGVRALELLDESSRELACGLAVRYSTRDPHTLQRDTAAVRWLAHATFPSGLIG